MPGRDTMVPSGDPYLTDWPQPPLPDPQEDEALVRRLADVHVDGVDVAGEGGQRCLVEIGVVECGEEDPDGPVTLSRFRRTIAWHIARLPGGTVALAIQYGHLRTLTSEGYSGRSRHGLRDLLNLETARAMASYLQDVSDSLDSGGGVSGPAARRLADAARHAASRFEELFRSPRQARALLADPALQVHDSPGAFLACNYDPAKAPCHPSREASGTAGHDCG
jgi:hypothetical protein